VQNPVAAELIEGTERMKARTYSPLIVWGRASRMSDWKKPSLQVGDVPADFHALTRRHQPTSRQARLLRESEWHDRNLSVRALRLPRAGDGSRRRLAQIPRFSAGCQGFGYR
jgi:hypothetical protein